ncbi:hypothetical protein LINGRAHAP2_LOCUS11654 [Linum grandiflorum]
MNRFSSRQRVYHRLRSPTTATRRRLKIARLGGGGGLKAASRKFINAIKKWWSKNVVVDAACHPLKVLAAFHKAYERAMMKLAAQMKKEFRLAAGDGRDSQIWELPASDGARVDDRVLLEFYSKLLASRQFVSLVKLG